MKAVILAAGQSSRFKPLSDNRHKGLTEVLGKPIIEHTIEELERIGIEDVVVVQGPDRKFEESLDVEAEFVVQENPEGMGHALRQAEHLLDEHFLVLNPYHATSSHIIEDLVEKAEEEGTELAFVSRETDQPEDYGILHIENGKAVGVTEKPERGEAPSNKRIVGMYLLNSDIFDYMDDVETWEYQFEDALDQQASENPGSIPEIEEETTSIKYPWNLFEFIEELMESRGRNISENASVADSAEIKGDVIVEDGAEIYEYAVIKGPAYIGEDVTVGNSTLVRDHTALERGVTIGANTEVKNSVFQPESSLHSEYFGDSIVGRNTHIGAGTITANRKFRENDDRPSIEADLIGKGYEKDTGRSFMGTVIGDDVDIGINVSLMPGVQIGSDAKIGPGTVVHENVEHGETVYVNQEQIRKDRGDGEK
ncbi:MAG: bifunctional sugar-1-phosphate nucleotidylyltransferase/acetyltransferase [Candidatus Nanosalina sp.]